MEATEHIFPLLCCQHFPTFFVLFIIALASFSVSLPFFAYGQ